MNWYVCIYNVLLCEFISLYPFNSNNKTKRISKWITFNDCSFIELIMVVPALARYLVSYTPLLIKFSLIIFHYFIRTIWVELNHPLQNHTYICHYPQRLQIRRRSIYWTRPSIVLLNTVPYECCFFNVREMTSQKPNVSPNE